MPQGKARATFGSPSSGLVKELEEDEGEGEEGWKIRDGSWWRRTKRGLKGAAKLGVGKGQLYGGPGSQTLRATEQGREEKKLLLFLSTVKAGNCHCRILQMVYTDPKTSGGHSCSQRLRAGRAISWWALGWCCRMNRPPVSLNSATGHTASPI